MLNKFVMFIVALVVCTGSLFAEVIVNAEGKVQKYPDTSTLNVAAATDLTIEYYGVRIFIPKGEKLSVRCSDVNEENSVFCSGSKFKNIKIGNDKFSTDRNVSFVISQKGELTLEKGSMAVTDKNNNTAVLEKGKTYTVEVSVVPADSFIPTGKITKQSQYEQMEKDIVLSPSSPRN